MQCRLSAYLEKKKKKKRSKKLGAIGKKEQMRGRSGDYRPLSPQGGGEMERKKQSAAKCAT